jgi:hypothetical protein
MPKKKEGWKEEKRKKEKKGKYQDLGSAASPSSLGHGRVGLDPFHVYIGSSTKTQKTRVYDGSGARGLLSARGPHVPHACGRIRDVLYGIL